MITKGVDLVVNPRSSNVQFKLLIEGTHGFRLCAVAGPDMCQGDTRG